MHIPFNAGQVLTLLTLLVAGVLAYAELKFGLRELQRRSVLNETAIEDLKARAANAALVEQAVQIIDQTVRDLSHELKNHQTALQGVEKLMIRIETQVEGQLAR